MENLKVQENFEYFLDKEKNNILNFFILTVLTQQRMKNYVSDIIFDNIRAANPEQLNKIEFIDSDISIDNLNMCKKDQDELIEKVNVIFHCAATINFNDPLKIAVNTNTTGIKRVLDFASKMKNLKAFVHMSTAFSHCYQIDMEERYYNTNLDTFEIMKLMEEFKPKELDELENEL